MSWLTFDEEDRRVGITPFGVFRDTGVISHVSGPDAVHREHGRCLADILHGGAAVGLYLDAVPEPGEAKGCAAFVDLTVRLRSFPEGEVLRKGKFLEFRCRSWKSNDDLSDIPKTDRKSVV